MAGKTFIRDGRAPVPRDERTSVLMSRIRAHDTVPERLLRKALLELGLRGYRLHYKRAPGRPDVAYVGRRVAVFVHGCFWHGCPYCSPKRPATHQQFWNTKLDRNRERDQEKVRALKRAGWSVVTVWACRLQKSPLVQARRVARALEGRRTF